MLKKCVSRQLNKVNRLRNCNRFFVFLVTAVPVPNFYSFILFSVYVMLDVGQIKLIQCCAFLYKTK